MKNKKRWEDLAKFIRKLILTSTTQAGSGHATSSLSAVELTTVLFDKYLRFDVNSPQNINNDRFLISKGHVTPLFYALWTLSGAIKPAEVLTLRQFDSVLEGHPTPRFKYADAATGSLGQGLGIGCGFALSAKKDGLPFKTYVLSGDGEMAEGSVWEALNFASFYKLDNLVLILDVNRLGQSGETMFGFKTKEYVDRLRSFGWDTIEVDGHNFSQIDKAFSKAQKAKKPFAIIAKTVKGKGVSFLENKDGWHGKALKKEELEKALLEIGKVDDGVRFWLKIPKNVIPNSFRDLKTDKMLKPASQRGEQVQHDNYKMGDQVATREAYGAALVKLGEVNPLIFALDGDVKNSTFSEKFKDAYPERFIECFIAEQNMAGVATGLSKRGKIPFASTFAAFFTRAFDQIRMSAISRANIKFVGSHAGVSIGEDGPSQMGLEDIAMFGAVPGSVILHPADAVSSEKLTFEMAKHTGISYLRTLRPKTPVLYSKTEKFPIGGSKILRLAQDDILTVIAAGITIHETLRAYEQLKQDGIMIRVVDCYCLKPIDKKTIEQCSHATMQPLIITVEDHYEHGGLGDFVLDAVSSLSNVKVIKLAVREISRSGKSEELLDAAKISAEHIVHAVKRAVQ